MTSSGEHWSKSTAMVEGWRARALHIINRTPPDWMGVDGSPASDAVGVLGVFHTEFPIRNYNSIEAYGQELVGWLDEQNAQMEIRTIYFECEVRLNNTIARFGAEADAVVKDTDDLIRAFNALSRRVMRSMPDNVVIAAAATSGAAVLQTTSNVSYEDCDLQRITRGHDGKNWITRAFGGRWQKHGVPLYDEVIKAAGLPIEASSLGEFPFKGTMQVMLEDGKPRRVTKINLDK